MPLVPLFLTLIISLLLPSPAAAQGDIFAKHGVKGTFILCPVDTYDCVRINTARGEQRFIPASTFKILNSLIALETGVIDGTEEVLPWDGRKHRITSWNQDQDMEHAFQRSCVWFYQELARRIGETRMRQFLNRTAYGNMNMGGGIDRFWLDGDLRISAVEQIGLLRRLWKEDLPFRTDVQRTVKRLMVLEKGDNYVLYGKTGLGDVDGVWYGWLVGFVERDGKASCYALNISSKSATLKEIAQLRHVLVRELLKEHGLL